MNVIRNYLDKEFDYLVAVVFDDDFDVSEAYLIPHKLIGEYFLVNKHQNGIVVRLTNTFVSDKRIKDITSLLQ